MTSHHVNSGKCPKCLEIIGRYPKFNQQLLEWFTAFQSQHPEAHVSCAGRGEAEQEADFAKGVTKAHWLESSHNFNAALDLFVLLINMGLYDKTWFNSVVGPAIPPDLIWYGKAGSAFYELPHVEIACWKEMRASGLLMPVEPDFKENL